MWKAGQGHGNVKRVVREDLAQNLVLRQTLDGTQTCTYLGAEPSRWRGQQAQSSIRGRGRRPVGLEQSEGRIQVHVCSVSVVGQGDDGSCAESYKRWW